MLCLILLFLYSSVFLLHYLTRVSIRWWQKVLIEMIDGGGYMESDRRDLLNPPTHTFHLSLSHSHTKISCFFSTLPISSTHTGSWDLSLLRQDPGWNRRDYVAVHMRAWSGALLLKSVKSGINLLQQRLGQSEPQDSECTSTHFSKWLSYALHVITTVWGL